MPITKVIYIPSLSEDIEYIIGKSAQENFEIIDDAEETDLWFHVEGYASSHVIAKLSRTYEKKELKYIIKQGAVLCKQHSKLASIKKVPIIYTTISNVEKTNTLGSVITNNQKIVTI